MDKNRSYKIKRKIWIEPDMFYSEPFMELSGSCIRTLMRCIQKLSWNDYKAKGKRKRREPVYTSDGFIFPYTEAAFLNIGTTQHWKNINTLIEKGFLDLVHQGGWYQKNQKTKDYSVYALSDRWKLYGTREFKSVKKEKVLQKHFYIRENLNRKTKPTSQK